MSIKSQIEKLKGELPSTVKLVAVSKYKPVEDILEAYGAGQRAFGENRPQELAAKAQALPKDIEWHFIGHLQSNKIKLVLPYASLIHSVDSEKLLSAINSAAAAAGTTASCLLEVHIASEESKQGFLPEEAAGIISRRAEWPSVRFRGLMGMGTFTDDKAKVRSEFRTLSELFRSIPPFEGFDTLSMGMSEDWPIAVEEGTTIVRIGTAIFGKRNYQQQ